MRLYYKILQRNLISLAIVGLFFPLWHFIIPAYILIMYRHKYLVRNQGLTIYLAGCKQDCYISQGKYSFQARSIILVLFGSKVLSLRLAVLTDVSCDVKDLILF